MSQAGTGARPRFRPRHARASIEDALADTRVVLVVGARQGGKSTLVDRVTRDRPAEVRTLDSVEHLEAARADPVGFVESAGLLAIDEIQRAPELLLAIKQQVDADPRPGRFLLTGSAQVMGLSAVADALPGRIETVELWPFSQGEIDARPDGFVDAVFDSGPAVAHNGDDSRSDYVDRVVRGGFPEAVARSSALRRSRFLRSYVDALVGRDVSRLSDIERPAETSGDCATSPSGSATTSSSVSSSTRGPRP